MPNRTGVGNGPLDYAEALALREQLERAQTLEEVKPIIDRILNCLHQNIYVDIDEES